MCGTHHQDHSQPHTHGEHIHDASAHDHPHVPVVPPAPWRNLPAPAASETSSGLPGGR